MEKEINIYPGNEEEKLKLKQKLDRFLESVPKWHDHFVWTPNEDLYFTKIEKPLAESKVALVSTAGVHLKSDIPFDVENEYGDWSYREIPSTTDPKDLMISDTHYDHTDADIDIDCLFPISHLRKLRSEGFIGDLTQSFWGFMGFVPNPAELKSNTAVEVANKLKKENVDIVFLTPGCAMCHHSIAIIQAVIESAGMATISITLKPEVTCFMNVPRAIYIQFPYGYSVGSAFQPELQYEIVRNSLDTLYKIEKAGTVIRLPYRWRGKRKDGE